jgi:membrane fusion protein, heavy metal efflux system
MRRWVAMLLLPLGLCAGCGDGSSPSPTAAAKTPPETAPEAAPPVVQTAHPEMRTRHSVLETSGKVAFNEERLVRVHAPVTGRVVEVLARPGDTVEPGTKLFVIESPELSAAKADYAKAVADGERAEKALGLTRELVEAKAIAQKELRDADNEYRKALAERERATARLRTLGVTEERFRDIASRADAGTTVTVTAPRSGVLVERNISPGQVVAYGQSDTPVNLFVIADLSTMWVVADVYEPDVARVRLGQAVTVTLPCCPGERFEGKVTYIADSVDPQTRTLKVRVVVPNRGRALKAEMFVKVALDTGAARVLAVPQSAVHRDGGKPFLLVEHAKGEYERRPVGLGSDLGEWVEVVNGVDPRESIVTTGGILLKRTVE